MPSKFHPITKINRHTTQYCTHNIEPINICTKKTATSENTVHHRQNEEDNRKKRTNECIISKEKCFSFQSNITYTARQFRKI